MEFIDQEKLKDKFGIYIITNNKNGKGYIGQTRQRFAKRYWHHRWKLRNNTHDNKYLQNAFNLYGEEAFTFSILEVVEDEEELNNKEEYYIKKYRNIDKCYNIQDGGQKVSNYIRTEEVRMKIGEKNRLNMLGKKHSSETKKKMSEIHKGKHYNRKNYKLGEDIAREIKTLLVSGIKPSSIPELINVSYKDVNNIMSSNSWNQVYVEGWDEFQSNRKITPRLKQKDYIEIKRLFTVENLTIQELAEKYERTTHAIKYALKKAN